MECTQIVIFAILSLQNDSEVAVTGTSETEGTSKNTRKLSTTFEYDKVFGPNSTQLDVFGEVGMLRVSTHCHMQRRRHLPLVCGLVSLVTHCGVLVAIP